MAVSPYITPELLNEWQRLMEADGAPRWWFNQITGNEAELLSGARVYIQFERDYIAQSLNQASRNIRNHLHYPLYPTYMSETINVDEYNEALQGQYLQTRYGHIQAFGTRATTEIESDASVTYSRVATASIDDTATITITDSTTSPDELQLFFRTADGAPSSAHENYRIYPVNVVRTNSTTLTVTGHRSLFAFPTLWAREYSDINTKQRNQGQTTDTSDFVTSVDAYRVYTDTATPITVYAEPTSNSSATPQSVSASGRIVDSLHGTFQVRFENTLTSQADSVQVNYLAGYPLKNQRVSPEMSIMVIRYANTLIPEQVEPIYDITFGRYAKDREAMPSAELQRMDINSPFGLQRGQIFAWRQVRAFTRGASIGAV